MLAGWPFFRAGGGWAVAGRNKAALRLPARLFCNARPQVVEARFDESRAELEEIESGRALPIGFGVLTK